MILKFYNFLKMSTKLKRRINSIEYVIWLNKRYYETKLWVFYDLLFEKKGTHVKKIKFIEKKRKGEESRSDEDSGVVWKECNIRIKLN